MVRSVWTTPCHWPTYAAAQMFLAALPYIKVLQTSPSCHRCVFVAQGPSVAGMGWRLMLNTSQSHPSKQLKKNHSEHTRQIHQWERSTQSPVSYRRGTKKTKKMTEPTCSSSWQLLWHELVFLLLLCVLFALVLFGFGSIVFSLALILLLSSYH